MGREHLHVLFIHICFFDTNTAMQRTYILRNTLLQKITLYLLSFMAMMACFELSAKPIHTSNRSAFARLYGLPTMADAKILAKGASGHSLITELSSQFVVEESANESLFLDGETSGFIYLWRYGLAKNMEFSLELPWLRHSGGKLDSTVEKWHDLFNFPNGGREQYPQNQLQFTLQTPVQTIFFDQTTEGLGDIGLQLAYQILDKPKYALSGHIRLDAPTGEFSRFTGSDKWDAALGLNVNHYGLFSAVNGVVYGQLGVLKPGVHRRMTAMAKSSVVYGGVGVSIPLIKNVNANVQLESHSAFFNSELGALADNTFQLSFGVDVRLNNTWQLDVAMSEDIRPTTAPDFTFHIALNYKL